MQRWRLVGGAELIFVCGSLVGVGLGSRLDGKVEGKEETEGG